MLNCLKISEIVRVELELSNICNLKCPLCLSQISQTKSYFIPKNRDFYEMIQQLDQFSSLQNVILAGDASEPTLYPQLFQLIEYLHKRNISIYLYTNGNTHDKKFWNKLGEAINGDDHVIFTVCGTTQELHEKYRVGSSLKQILENVQYFRETNKDENDFCSYIKFAYNEKDSFNANRVFKDKFSDFYIVNTDPRFEWFNLCEKDDNNGISLVEDIRIKYKLKTHYIKNKKSHNIVCWSKEKKMVRIDNFGNIYPCICYALYCKDKFENNGILNYNNILSNKVKYCHNCDKEMLDFFKVNHLPGDFYMCN